MSNNQSITINQSINQSIDETHETSNNLQQSPTISNNFQQFFEYCFSIYNFMIFRVRKCTVKTCESIDSSLERSKKKKDFLMLVIYLDWIFSYFKFKMNSYDARIINYSHKKRLIGSFATGRRRLHPAQKTGDWPISARWSFYICGAFHRDPHEDPPLPLPLFRKYINHINYINYINYLQCINYINYINFLHCLHFFTFKIRGPSYPRSRPWYVGLFFSGKRSRLYSPIIRGGGGWMMIVYAFLSLRR